MTASNHALTGALIATVITEPLLAIPLAFASHFVCDIIPHFGYKDTVNFGSHFRHRLPKYVTAFDFILLLVLVGVLLHYSVDAWVYVAAFVAIAPDFEWLVAYYGFERKGKKPWRSIIAGFHAQIQWCERPWGIFVEIAWYTTGLWLLINLIK